MRPRSRRALKRKLPRSLPKAERVAALHEDGFGLEDDVLQRTRAGSKLIDLEAELPIDRIHDTPDLLREKKWNLEDLI